MISRHWTRSNLPAVLERYQALDFGSPPEKMLISSLNWRTATTTNFIGSSLLIYP